MLDSSNRKYILTLWGFIVASLLMGFAGLGTLLTLVFPMISLVVGYYYYQKSSTSYIQLVWWLWFLTPLIRRISDHYSSYIEPSTLLLAPFVVTLVSMKGFFADWTQQKLPFLLSLYAVVYGTTIGLFLQTPISVIIASLDWFVPVAFGAFIFSQWHQYPAVRDAVQSTFLWGILIMGIYGVIQFLVLPAWDQSWMINADFASAGRPEPLMVNVWSTMSSNRPLSTVFMAGLLYLLAIDRKGPIFLGANIFGFLTFLLARKRTSWLSFVIGLMLLMSSLNAKKQTQIIVTAIAISVCLVPLVMMDPFSDFIVGRLESFSELDSDGSAAARQETYTELLDEALTSWIGEGFGRGSFDSAILSSLLSIGWFGSLLYFGGLFMLFAQITLAPLPKQDSFAAASRAIAFATLSQLPLGQPHVEVQGMILWSSIALCLSSAKYYCRSG